MGRRMLDALGKLKEAGSHEEYPDTWKEELPSMDWKGGANPAIRSEKATKKFTGRKAAPDNSRMCKREDCNQYTHKGGLCADHYREQRRVYKKRQEVKKRHKRAIETGRACEVCGDYVPTRHSAMLCREHLTDEHKKRRVYENIKKTHSRYEEETNQIIEETTERKRKLISERWEKIQAEYARGER